MEEKKLKILAIQMSSKIGDKWDNYSKILELVEGNIKRGTDIIILPEVWTVGWKTGEFQNSAEDLEDSETVEFLSNIAQRYNVNIIGGSFIRKDAKMQRRKDAKRIKNYASMHPTGLCLYNTCPVINRKGELVATYDKMHLFSYYGCEEGSYVEKGQNPVMVYFCPDSREIASGDNYNGSKVGRAYLPDGIKIGLSICYDIRFPEIYRAYRKAGADLLINMAAWPMSRAIHWEVLTKARAIENQCFMVALTQSGLIEGNEWNLGHSMIIDCKGEIISEIKEGEGAMFAEIKFNEMYKFREKCTVLLDIHDSYEVE